MDIFTIIASTIAGLAVVAIAGTFNWLFFRKKTKPNSPASFHKQNNNTIVKSEIVNINQSMIPNQILITEEDYKQNIKNAVKAKELEIKAAYNKEKVSRKKSDDIKATASEQGSVAVGKAGGDINISNVSNTNPFTPEQLERMIQLERKDAVEEFKKASSDSAKAEPLSRINEFDKRLANFPEYFQETLELIVKGIAVTKSIFDRNIGSGFNVTKLTEVMFALGKGEFLKADALFAEIETYKELIAPDLASIALTRGEIAEQQIRWDDATEHYDRAVRLDPNFNTLIRAQKLAISMGKYPSALSLGEKAKKIAIEEHGKDSEQYANIINNLGGLYEAQKQYKKAKILFTESLEIRKEKFGYNHPATANSLNNLASIYSSEGHYEEAEKRFKQAIEIFEKTVGENDPSIANSLNNLAGLYYSQRKYKESEKFYLQALKIRQDGLDKNHPLTATTLNNLAMVYEKQKRYKDADFYYQQSLEIFETVLGPNHLNTKATKANYEENKTHLANDENDEPQ